MPGPSAVRVVLSTRQRKILKKLRRQQTLPQSTQYPPFGFFSRVGGATLW